MTKPRLKIAQIRLLLPEEWITELDNLAGTRFLKRLQLIRFYLRAQMNEDLSKLAEHFKETDQNKKTNKRLEQRRQDKEW
jgi:hypothetical protein